MKKIYIFLTLLLIPFYNFAQINFANTNARMNNVYHSGCPLAIYDFNYDGLDDIVHLDLGKDLYVDYQKTNGQFQTQFLGSFSSNTGWAWAMCIADFDHNGYADVMAGGSSSSVRIFMTNNTGTSATLVNLPSSSFFLQNITLADINNDGWIDAFLCDDNAESHVYLNNGSGVLAPSTIIDFDVTQTDDSGNYGSVWTDFDNDGDFDLYIAKCRQGVSSPSDGRRINVLFENDGLGNFTETADTHGLAIGWQSWTASFGDLDNDGDLDLLVTNHDYDSQILENDGNGNFTDITSSTNFDITDITAIESVIEDFDNDGYADLFITGSDSRFYLNNGNMTFTKIDNLFDSNEMESFAIGDLNHDGFIDIMGGYANIYTSPTSTDDVYWRNTGNSNNWITLDLRGTLSNHSAIGVRATLYSNGSLQIRESKAGESYGTSNTAMVHFGLGTSTSIDSITLLWPSGIFQTIVNPSINQFLNIIENDCVSPEAIITVTGALIICPGQTTTLTAPAGYNYLWSDGSTNQALLVTGSGEYNVRVSTTGSNCSAVSKTISILYNPDETPSIEHNGETTFCNGSSITINGPSNLSNYNWSNGSTNSSIVVNQSGTYTLSYNGMCQTWTSAPVNVTVIDPQVNSNNVSIPVAGTANLVATGNNIVWYDDAGGTNAVGAGNNWTTPFLNQTSTFYVQAADSFGGGVEYTGLPYHGGTSNYSGPTTNSGIYFNVSKSCLLESVKVYTDLTGDRNILLLDSSGNTINNLVVTINPDTQVIALNWMLQPGVAYYLTTDAAYNNAIPGWNTASPRLKRNSSDVSYPYVINNVLSLTGSPAGGGFYYYFYDWKVDVPPNVCYSTLLPVTVTVLTTGVNELQGTDILVYPNPSLMELNIQSSEHLIDAVEILDASGRLIFSTIDNQQPIITIDTEELSKGVYFVRIKQNDQYIHTKFLKQ